MPSSSSHNTCRWDSTSYKSSCTPEWLKCCCKSCWAHGDITLSSLPRYMANGLFPLLYRLVLLLLLLFHRRPPSNALIVSVTAPFPAQIKPAVIAEDSFKWGTNDPNVGSVLESISCLCQNVSVSQLKERKGRKRREGREGREGRKGRKGKNPQYSYLYIKRYIYIYIHIIYISVGINIGETRHMRGHAPVGIRADSYSNLLSSWHTKRRGCRA